MRKIGTFLFAIYIIWEHGRASLLRGEKWSIRIHHTQRFLSSKVNTDTLKGAKKSTVSQVEFRPRETEGKEKEEGSLNMLVVPKESREISPMKAGD